MVNHSVCWYVFVNCNVHFVHINLNMITARLLNELQPCVIREWRNIRIILSIGNRLQYFILLESATSDRQTLTLHLICLWQIGRVSNPVIITSLYATSHLKCAILCGTNLFLTVNHDIYTLRLQQHYFITT